MYVKIPIKQPGFHGKEPFIFLRPNPGELSGEIHHFFLQKIFLKSTFVICCFNVLPGNNL